jgi:hypothetical protein
MRRRRTAFLHGGLHQPHEREETQDDQSRQDGRQHRRQAVPGGGEEPEGHQGAGPVGQVVPDRPTAQLAAVLRADCSTTCSVTGPT